MAKPDLSQIASNSWGDNFDVDSIIASENKAMEAASTAPTTTPTNSSTQELQVTPPSQLQTESRNPAAVRYNAPQVDTRAAEYKNMLDDTPTALDPNFQDSGTVTPQQNLNPDVTQQQPTAQQEIEDNNQIDDGDPYLLAFNILQEFDMIRLPENVDYNKLDLNTLAMYKEETLQMQRDEALEFVRSQVAYDPLMSQLFDYAYYGKQFADLPKMQGILKREFDFATYDITSEKAQRAIVKLYHSDGLNPQDNRDNSILRDIPNKINKLAEDLKLKQEALIAKQFFVAREQQKAAIEEQKILDLIVQQDQIEYQRQVTDEQWNAAFGETLHNSNWSEGRKAAVANEASYITLNNGQQMPLWQYKQEIMFDNPILFQKFLDFTSKFNEETGVFEDSDATEEIPQSTLNQIVQRLQNKSNTSKSTAGTRNPQGDTQRKQPRVADVNRNWF